METSEGCSSCRYHGSKLPLLTLSVYKQHINEK